MEKDEAQKLFIARNAALEEAARWHDEQATLWDAIPDSGLQAGTHRFSASALREMKLPRFELGEVSALMMGVRA